MSQGVAIVFPGQGSQSVGMLELYFSKEKKFNYVFDQSKEVLGVDFKDLILNGTIFLPSFSEQKVAATFASLRPGNLKL